MKILKINIKITGKFAMIKPAALIQYMYSLSNGRVHKVIRLKN